MITKNNEENLICDSYKNRYNLVRLLSNFDFNLDPSDTRIKTIQISSVRLRSHNGYYSLIINISKEEINLLDYIKIYNLEVCEVELSINFYDDKSIFVQVRSDSTSDSKSHPVINKYLENWGILESNLKN